MERRMLYAKKKRQLQMARIQEIKRKKEAADVKKLQLHKVTGHSVVLLFAMMDYIQHLSFPILEHCSSAGHQWHSSECSVQDCGAGRINFQNRVDSDIGHYLN